MIKDTLRYFDFRYYLRFAGLFFLFYGGFLFVVAAAAPSGFYFPFVEQYLNFPVPIRSAVLYSSQYILSLLDYNTVLSNDQLRSADGYSILVMAWACLGMGVQSFWLAFILAHKMSLRKKLNWCLLGICSVFVINCLRVVLMMIALIDKWPIANYLGTNAHDLFNYLSYALLLGLVLYFYKKTETKKRIAVESSKTKAAIAQPSSI